MYVLLLTVVALGATPDADYVSDSTFVYQSRTDSGRVFSRRPIRRLLSAIADRKPIRRILGRFTNANTTTIETPTQTTIVYMAPRPRIKPLRRVRPLLAPIRLLNPPNRAARGLKWALPRQLLTPLRFVRPIKAIRAARADR